VAGFELDARLASVLVRVVEQYVGTAEAVSSRAIARQLPVSSATVRAAMARLGELGLLAKPHASAGRVPTEDAFRLYVQRLMREAPWPRAERSRAEGELAETSGADELLRRAADLLSESTGQLGFVVAPPPERVRLRRIQFVRLASERVLALLIQERGGVHTRVIEEAEADQRTLDEISTRLSELVSGLTLAEARARLEGAVERERERSAVWRKALALGSEGLRGEAAGELYVADADYLLGQPEFNDVRRVRELLAALAEKERMLRLVEKLLRADAVGVAIGAELEEPAMGDCALVTAPLGSPAAGGLGVIGPVRMSYARVIPVVRRVSELVGEFLA
jgi:heat-inducible transcriptional repressor